MLKSSLIFTCLLLIVFCFNACQNAQPTKENEPQKVYVVGAMKEVMWKGELASQIDLDTLSQREGLIALGPESYLKGELMILDGESYISRVTSDSSMEVINKYESGAPFLVYARVKEWNRVDETPNFQSVKEVEDFLKALVKDHDQAFPFKLIGKVNSARVHVQNLPKGTKVSSPKEAHQGQVNYTLQGEEVIIAGFYSEKHQGIFTHHDAFTHMHLLTKDKSKMGHLDEVNFEEVELFLPSYLEWNVLKAKPSAELIVLGTVQDAGSPHIACSKACCKGLFEKIDPNRKVVALGLIDHQAGKSYLFEATANIATQLKELKLGASDQELPDGIFLTHAHIGHYSGLMYLGKEAANADSVPVYAMPKMKRFLETNAPWSQLVDLKNIALQPFRADSPLILTPLLKVSSFLVPHRDEFSETVGFMIQGPHKKVLFIPDIDKWGKWTNSIVQLIKEVDLAFLDATFFSGEEIAYRDISEIPHPFVIESMELFKGLSATDKEKVHFIHFNHTNPLLNTSSKEYNEVVQNGYRVSAIGERFEL